MGQILDAIIEFFADEKWEATPIEGKTALGMHFNGEHGLWHSVAWGREPQSEFVFYSIYSENIPEGKRTNVAELLTRINYGLILGNFEMDFDDGELRYKTSIDIEDGDLTTNLIRPVVYINLVNIDKYLPAVQAVVENDVTPRDALAQIVSDDEA